MSIQCSQTDLEDQNRVRWPGSGSTVSGSTVYHFYDNDVQFVTDCANSAKWAAIRLGYPNVDVELIDVHFYAAFEEAVNQYGATVNEFNIINNLHILHGMDITEVGSVNNRAIYGNSLPYVIEIGKVYGTEAGAGGNVDWKRGYIDVNPNQQVYDIQSLWADVSESFNRIEIKRVFHHRSPAAARVYDPMSMTGMSYANVMNEMGFAGYSPATQFLMTPIFEDLLRIQGIEFNDTIRKSAYSFELINNKIRIFPIPDVDFKMFFEYIVEKDRSSGSLSPASGSGASGSNVISDFSDVPYNNMVYSKINDVGRNWIKKYFLAICKEILGAIRQKYQTIPIPKAEVTLDGAELRSEAQQEKETLITQLRESLTEAGRRKRIEAAALEVEQMQTIIKQVPLQIYIM